MPPDASQVRQRRTIGGKDDANVDDATRERLCTLDHLKPHEVCIDGNIYDLTSFYHPGGESINVFGGNDVSATYRMIHPYHTSKHLEKMTKVGTVADYAFE